MHFLFWALRIWVAMAAELPHDYKPADGIRSAFAIAAVTNHPGIAARLAVQGYQESRYQAIRHRSGKVCGVVQIKARGAYCERLLSDTAFAYAEGLRTGHDALAYCATGSGKAYRKRYGFDLAECQIAVYAGGPSPSDPIKRAEWETRILPKVRAYVRKTIPRIERLSCTIAGVSRNRSTPSPRPASPRS